MFYTPIIHMCPPLQITDKKLAKERASCWCCKNLRSRYCVCVYVCVVCVWCVCGVCVCVCVCGVVVIFMTYIDSGRVVDLRALASMYWVVPSGNILCCLPYSFSIFNWLANIHTHLYALAYTRTYLRAHTHTPCPLICIVYMLTD